MSADQASVTDSNEVIIWNLRGEIQYCRDQGYRVIVIHDEDSNNAICRREQEGKA